MSAFHQLKVAPVDIKYSGLPYRWTELPPAARESPENERSRKIRICAKCPPKLQVYSGWAKSVGRAPLTCATLGITCKESGLGIHLAIECLLNKEDSTS